MEQGSLQGIKTLNWKTTGSGHENAFLIKTKNSFQFDI